MGERIAKPHDTAVWKGTGCRVQWWVVPTDESYESVPVSIDLDRELA